MAVSLSVPPIPLVLNTRENNATITHTSEGCFCRSALYLYSRETHALIQQASAPIEIGKIHPSSPPPLPPSSTSYLNTAAPTVYSSTRIGIDNPVKSIVWHDNFGAIVYCCVWHCSKWTVCGLMEASSSCIYRGYSIAQMWAMFYVVLKWECRLWRSRDGKWWEQLTWKY